MSNRRELKESTNILAWIDRHVAAAKAAHAIESAKSSEEQIRTSQAVQEAEAARDAVKDLIETLEHVEQWMENHALPALCEDTDGGNSLLAGVQDALALAGASQSIPRNETGI